MSKDTSKSASKTPAKSPEQVEIDTIAKAELKLVEKYGKKIVKGSVRRATDPRYGKKLMVTINTRGVNGKFDKQTREIASSDVFQVHHTVEVAAELRKQRSADKRAVAAAKREAAKPATTEEAASTLGV